VRRSLRLSTGLLGILLLLPCLALLGCTPRIPDRVTAEEMALYSEWLKSRFADKTPEHLYIDDQTFIYDPTNHRQCDSLHKDQGVSSSLCKRLHELGNAEYGLEFSSGSFNLPWPYQVLNPRRMPVGTPTTLHIIGFSRIAFNRGHSEALFAISDSCGGECGGGGPVHARKVDGAWKFTYIAGWIY